MQYLVPDELRGLSLYEELLIQKAAPYIPIIHVKNGAFGLKGHCIIFERESQGDIKQLPRCKSDVVCFNRQYGTREDGSKQKQMSMKANRKVLMNALTFLQKNHKSYNNIFIVEPKKKTLQGDVDIVFDGHNLDDENKVSSSYCHDVESLDITFSTVETIKSAVPENDANVDFVNNLKECVKKHNASVPIFDFPPTKNEPLRCVGIIYNFMF